MNPLVLQVAIPSKQDLQLEGAVGLDSGAPSVAGLMSGSFGQGTATVSGTYDGTRLAASYFMSAHDKTGSYRVSFSVADAFTEYGRFSVSANYFADSTSVFLLGTAALGSQAASQAQIGASTQVAALRHGALAAAAAIGEPRRMAPSRTNRTFARVCGRSAVSGWCTDLRTSGGESPPMDAYS